MSHVSGRGALLRTLGLPGAVIVGLGAMLGTGVFVSLGIAAGHAGSQLPLALVLAAALAACNALSSAQLAAAHPVSGGTYEYGYRLLHPAAGFVAGWLFLCAKSASAAAAVLGVGGYLGHRLGAPVAAGPGIGLAALALVTLVVLLGLRRTQWLNLAMVSVTVSALGAFIVLSVPEALPDWPQKSEYVLPGGHQRGGLWTAVALCFVAYTGYGRIATMGEEVRDPARTIPRAVGWTIAITLVLYAGVAFVALGLVSPVDFYLMSAGGAEVNDATRGDGQVAPLARLAHRVGGAPLAAFMSVAALTALLGVTLNLVLGLSRVVLAMGRRHDLPPALAGLTGEHRTPALAVLLVAGVIGVQVALGSIVTAWSFSAITVLVYYALTNLAALRLPPAERRFSPIIAIAGLFGCALLSLFVGLPYALAALCVLAAGFVLRALCRWAYPHESEAV